MTSDTGSPDCTVFQQNSPCDLRSGTSVAAALEVVHPFFHVVIAAQITAKSVRTVTEDITEDRVMRFWPLFTHLGTHSGKKDTFMSAVQKYRTLWIKKI